MQATIGITTGDPAGIGLEVTFKSIAPFLSSARHVLFTDHEAFERNASAFPANFGYRWISHLSQVRDEPVLFLYDAGIDSSKTQWGKLSIEAGRRSMAYLNAASRAALEGSLDAIVTAPVNKEAIGGEFRGQTDFLAEQAGRSRFAMAFFAPTFKVVLATIHLSLRDALSRITTDLYLGLIRLIDSELRRFAFERRRIAVAGINPHAGEGGMFGSEDRDILKPAVDRCAAEGISVSGPHPADSLYYRAHTGEFDVVIAPYHDQGLVPIKIVAHGQATNVTLGLPFIRTSPDHGTAFGIAGKGLADSTGMTTALTCALDLVKRKGGG